jgi:hypothetical protein
VGNPAFFKMLASRLELGWEAVAAARLAASAAVSASAGADFIVRLGCEQDGCFGGLVAANAMLRKTKKREWVKERGETDERAW